MLYLANRPPEEVRQGQKVTTNEISGLHAMHICTLNRAPNRILYRYNLSEQILFIPRGAVGVYECLLNEDMASDVDPPTAVSSR